MMRLTGIFLGLAGLIFFGGQPLQAFACGDVITQYDYGDGLIDERTPINNCANPFNADVPDPFTYTLTLNDQEVTPGVVVMVPEGALVEGSFSIAKSNNAEFAPLQIFRKEGSDYREIKATNQASFTLAELVAGEYVATLIYSEPSIGISATEPDWKQWLKSFFLPATAYAYYQDYQDVVAIQFTVTYETPLLTGPSSVLFLPGIKASRLYTDRIFGFENQLWEPTVNTDVAKLAMTPTGESLESVYTRDILDKVPGLGSVYGDISSFFDSLVTDGVIDDWEPYAYDWRYDVFDVVKNGTLQGDSEATARRVYVQDIVRKLAESSKSGKVTIVAHSNGGLLAKALLIELEKTGETDLVDSVILVASPQLGTPKAIGTLLHGYGEELLGGLVVDDELARKVTQNMPGPYGLLPGKRYFETVPDAAVVSFEDSDATAQFRNAYGPTVYSETELINFLIGQEGRGQAVEIEDALHLNPVLLSKTMLYRQNQLDTWQAPDDVSVYEVVGTGVETENGFYYREFLERACEPMGIFGQYSCQLIKKSKPLPRFTFYGDGTVVGASAEGYQGTKGTFYYDLFINDEINHANITETNSLQSLVRSILEQQSQPVNFITTQQPAYANSSIILGAHSPVQLLVIDSQGNRTGKQNSKQYDEIPGSSYREIAGSKYVILPEGISYTVQITGEAEGGYSLTQELLKPDGTQTTIREILSATTTASTTVSFECNQTECSLLLIDYNSDGISDATHDWRQQYVSNNQIVGEKPELDQDEVSSKSSSGTRVPNRDTNGQVAGVNTTIELQRLYAILLQIKVLLDNWPKL